MRWDELFADLETQLYAAGQLALESEANERARMDQAALALVDRLRGHCGAPLRVRLGAGLAFEGTLSHVGPSWIVLDEPARSVLVPLDAVQVVEGLGRAAVPDGPLRPRRLGLASALRGLARDREEVMLHLSARPGGGFDCISGTIDRVGKDFLELAAVPSGEARRASNVRGIYAVPFTSVAALASLRRA